MTINILPEQDSKKKNVLLHSWTRWEAPTVLGSLSDGLHQQHEHLRPGGGGQLEQLLDCASKASPGKSFHHLRLVLPCSFFPTQKKVTGDVWANVHPPLKGRGNREGTLAMHYFQVSKLHSSWMSPQIPPILCHSKKKKTNELGSLEEKIRVIPFLAFNKYLAFTRTNSLIKPKNIFHIKINYNLLEGMPLEKQSHI